MLNRFIGPVSLFFAFTLAGTSVVSARIVSGKLGTFTIAAVSLFFSLFILLPVCGKKLFQVVRTITAKDYLLMFLQALFGIFLFRMCLLNGLKHTSSGEAGILTGATPAITALLALIFLKESLNLVKLSGIVSTVAGILLVQGIISGNSAFTGQHFWGNLLVIGAAACESLFNMLSRLFAVRYTPGKSHNLPPQIQTLIVTVIALLLCLIPSISEQPVKNLMELGLKEWFALLWYGIFVTALAFIFWYEGINRCGAVLAAAFSGMMPLTSMLLSALLLGEIPSLQQFAGGGCVVAGIVLIGSSQSHSSISNVKRQRVSS